MRGFVYLFILNIISFSSANNNQLLCHYELNDELYSCEILFANITNDKWPLQIQGTHHETKNNSHVTFMTAMTTRSNFSEMIGVLHQQLIPQFQNLEYLGLSRVNMKNFANKAFEKCNSIIWIDLSKNNIVSIGTKSLSNCKNLKVLNLSYNSILEVGDNGFDGLTNLEVLDLSHNQVKFSQKAISPMTKLKELYLKTFKLKDNNSLNIFSSLKLLEVIDLSYFNSTFETVKILTSGLNNLKHMHLSYNYYYQIDFEFLCHFNLTILFLNGNLLTDIPRNSFINSSHLITLEISTNYLQFISEWMLNGLDNLEHLSLDSNAIDKIHENAFDHLLRLYYLDISRNLIESLSPNVFKNLGNLEILLVSGNKIVSFKENAFSGLINIQFLFLDYNRIERLDSSAFGLLNTLIYLDVSKNMILQIEESFFQNFPNLQSFIGEENLCFNFCALDFSETNIPEVFRECFIDWKIPVNTENPPNVSTSSTTTELIVTTTTESDDENNFKISVYLIIIAFLVNLLK